MPKRTLSSSTLRQNGSQDHEIQQPKRQQKATKPDSRDNNKQSQDTAFQETDSIYQQAKPYLLATAKLPLDALTCSWRIGNNRRLDPQHVANLCQSFHHGNLARQTEENYLLVLCSSQAIRSMMGHLGSKIQREDVTAIHTGHMQSFEDWLDVNDEKPEVMAGQHRIAALQKYVEQTGSPKTELWWNCKFYDRG